MRSVRQIAAALLGILVALAGSGADGVRADYRPSAAAHPGNGGSQGISGRPQKNAAVKGSPKANSSINGAQIRGKR